MKIDGYTRLAAVVANPIKHSISPFIHNSAFEATNTNGVYLAWEVDATELAVPPMVARLLTGLFLFCCGVIKRKKEKVCIFVP